MARDWNAEMQVMRQQAIAELQEFLNTHLRDLKTPDESLQTKAAAIKTAASVVGDNQCTTSRLRHNCSLADGVRQTVA
jgi:uncharacterized protein involved in exopolysaccharide biosynthesis